MRKRRRRREACNACRVPVWLCVVRARVAAGIEPALAICDTGRGDRVERGDALVARFEQRRPLVVPVPAGHTQAA